MEGEAAMRLKRAADRLAVTWNDRAISRGAAEPDMPFQGQDYWHLLRRRTHERNLRNFERSSCLTTRSVSSLEFPEKYSIDIFVTKMAHPARNINNGEAHIFLEDMLSFRNLLYNVAVAGQIFLDAEVAHNDM